MTTLYADNTGRTVELGPLIAKGGEGAVYQIVGNPQLVAKIYHQPPAAAKVEKLTAMVRLADPNLNKYAAWPLATLHVPPSPAVCGILLPRLNRAKEIYKLYSPAERATVFPAANWHFLVRAARNMATAFDSLHQRKVVIGDVNQGNVFVSDQALVSLIDCDSFQITRPRGAFLCEVGVPHFTPPELQTANFAQTPRTPNHDNFGLAVLIFHLLFMGRHPFAGRYSGAGDMPIERAISEHRFAFGHDAARGQMSPPPNSLTLQNLPGDLRSLFERAFGKAGEAPDARPSAAQWGHALAELEGTLVDCQFDPGHTYPKTFPPCPWCLIVGKGGPNFFISVTIRKVSSQSGQFDFTVLWREAQALEPPGRALQPPPLPRHPIVPRPLPSDFAESSTLTSLVGWAAFLGFVMLCAGAFIPYAAAFGAPTVVVFGVWFSVLYFTSSLGRERTSRRAVLVRARFSLWQAQRALQEAAQRSDIEFQERFRKLQQFQNRWCGLDGDMQHEKETLTQTASDRQRTEFLRGQILQAGVIDGFGEARVAMLRSYGIETALDISPSAVDHVPGIGETLGHRLCGWRDYWEHQFKFDPAKGVPRADLNAIALKYFQQRFDLYRRLQMGLTELKNTLVQAQEELNDLAARKFLSAHAVDQAAADLGVATKSQFLGRLLRR